MVGARHHRLKLRFWVASMAMLAGLLAANGRVAGHPAKEHAAPAATADASYRGGIVTPPLPKPNFTLTDTSGAPFDLRSETQGYVTLLYFGYTYCPEECPLHMANIAAALKDLPAADARQIRVVFVTTDPARDTAEVLRSWLDQFDERFVGLGGGENAVRSAQIAAGIPPAIKTSPSDGNNEIDHEAFILAYSKDNLAHLIYPSGITAEDWVHDLRRLVQENWSRQ